MPNIYYYYTTTILRPSLWDYPGEPVLEETHFQHPFLPLNLARRSEGVLKLPGGSGEPGC